MVAILRQPARPQPAAPDFIDLARWEPGLESLARRVRIIGRRRGRRRSWCALAVLTDATGDFVLAQLERLVGRYRVRVHPDPQLEAVLRSSHAFEVAYDHLDRLLPDCRGGCSC
jgi:hypothetical protein